MVTKTKTLGVVKLVQVQPSGLIIETPAGEIYDPSRRVEVDQLLISEWLHRASAPFIGTGRTQWSSVPSGLCL